MEQLVPFSVAELDLPSPEEGRPLFSWVREALAATGEARDAKRERVAEALFALRREGGQEASRVLHRLLDAHALDELEGCRALAVESLLALGFPHALEVTPEDLEFYRAHQRGARQGWWPWLLGSGATLGVTFAVLGDGPWALGLAAAAGLVPVVGFGWSQWRGRAIVRR